MSPWRSFPASICLLVSFHLITGAGPTANAHALSVYLQEGFNGPGLPSGWTVTQVSGSTATWTVVGTGTNPPIPPYEGTGQAKFNSYDATSGDQARLVSRSMSLSTSTDPFVSFFLYHDDEFLSSFDSVYVEAATGDSIAGPWTTLAGYSRPRTTPGWERETVSLLSYSGAGRVFVSFRGVSEFGNNLYVDEVIVADSSFHDIGAVALYAPAGPPEPQNVPTNASRGHNTRAHLNRDAQTSQMLVTLPSESPLNLGAIVQNDGTFPEPTYQLGWQIDGQNQVAVSNSRILPRNGRDTLTLSWPTPSPGAHGITAWTSLGADSNRSNDTVRLTVVVLDSNVIFAEMFNGGVFPPTGWTVVNRDGGSLPPWFQGSATSIFLPYEGTGFAADNFQRANGTYIDDYLISPPIAGIAQGGREDSLRLWTRSAFNPPPETNYPDSLMILLSTTGADTSNFSTIVDYFAVPKTGWTLKAYRLTGRIPDNSTVRIAFRYLHYNGGPSGSSSDFVGVDFVHVVHGLPTAVRLPGSIPPVFSLEQNYPNPFNPVTEIHFSVPAGGTATLDVHDILGQKVATLFDGPTEPGMKYQVRMDGSRLASGVYYYVLRTRSAGATTTFSDVKRMLLLK